MKTLDSLFYGIFIYTFVFADTYHVNTLLKGETKGIDLNTAIFDLTLCLICGIILIIKIFHTKQKIKTKKG